MFMALDPSVFVDDFPARLNGLMSDLRNMEPVSLYIPYPIPHSDSKLHFTNTKMYLLTIVLYSYLILVFCYIVDKIKADIKFVDFYLNYCPFSTFWLYILMPYSSKFL